ncbi:hypothetical protein [Bifidobacterium longum]|uniref:hypothetical protein n=1 Tax=Bifidobacterium longum TaxID=216816 RepID=UPI0011D04E4C|nr:hypothetical protein [Bifidobacterium longum]
MADVAVLVSQRRHRVVRGGVRLHCDDVLGFFRGFGVPVLVEIRYEPAPGVSSVTYSVHARDWQAKRTVDAGSTVVLRGEAVRNMRVNRFYSKGPWLTFTLNVYDNNGFLSNYAMRYMQVVVLPVPARSQEVCVVLGKRFVGACGSATVGGAAAECVAGIVRSSVAPQCPDSTCKCNGWFRVGLF